MLKYYSFWGFKAGPEHWLIFADFCTTSPLCYVGKICGETIGNTKFTKLLK